MAGFPLRTGGLGFIPEERILGVRFASVLLDVVAVQDFRGCEFSLLDVVFADEERWASRNTVRAREADVAWDVGWSGARAGQLDEPREEGAHASRGGREGSLPAHRHPHL